MPPRILTQVPGRLELPLNEMDTDSGAGWEARRGILHLGTCNVGMSIR